MFDSLINQYYLHYLQPRVVHRLPGRLRVNIPALMHMLRKIAAALDQKIRIEFVPAGHDVES